MHMQTTKAKTSLRKRAGWSWPTMFVDSSIASFYCIICYCMFAIKALIWVPPARSLHKNIFLHASNYTEGRYRGCSWCCRDSTAVIFFVLTLKAPVTAAADDFFFSEKTSLDISCESSVWQTIHMKCQDLFSLKNNNNIKKK